MSIRLQDPIADHVSVNDVNVTPDEQKLLNKLDSEAVKYAN